MKFLKILITLIVLLLTIVICAVKPSLHKAFVIKGADFKLERYSEKSPTPKNLVNTPYKSIRDVKIEQSVFLSGETNQADNVIVEHEVLTENKEFITEETQNKKLSKKEEIIAWNKWRSNLQNEIMLNANVVGTLGSMFYFSFKVDKFRHISDIRAFCTNPFFQNEVSDKLVPVIKNYEYSQILEFPKGSERQSTKFNGMFIIWNETSLSTPNDFNDIERVNVYE